MKFTVVGMGYVGASAAALLARKHHVFAVDISQDKLDIIKQRKLPIADETADRLFAEEGINIHIAGNTHDAYRESDCILIATPTNYDEKTGHLDTASVESVIKDITASGSDAVIVIKSTVPIGFTERMQSKYPGTTILYAPEFLREGNAMQDQLNPSRVVIGTAMDREDMMAAANDYASLLKECIDAKDTGFLIMSYGEAESVKLFSNTYLAMRVAFFNELDTLAETRGYDAGRIIDGVCQDPRIGDYYNNPSFGYGGYCLPKDTRELLSDYEKVPEKLMHAIVESNEERMKFIAETILKKLEALYVGGKDAGDETSQKPVVGIYRLTMKSGSSNFRESPVLNVLSKLKQNDVKVIIYEPLLDINAGVLEAEGCELIDDIEDFKAKSDLIIANRKTNELEDVMEKVYTRDIYLKN